MLLKRRKPAGWIETFRVSIWPRHSWKRSWQYVSKRIIRLSASPHTIAIGVSVGALASFTPFVGLHFVLAFILALIFRGNLVAAALGTFVGNPISFPFIWITTHEIGNFLISLPSTGDGPLAIPKHMASIIAFTVSFQWTQAINEFALIWKPILYPMLIGGAILGTMTAVIIYLIVKPACHAFQITRQKRIITKQKMKNIKPTKRKYNKIKKQKMKTVKVKMPKMKSSRTKTTGQVAG